MILLWNCIQLSNQVPSVKPWEWLEQPAIWYNGALAMTDARQTVEKNLSEKK